MKITEVHLSKELTSHIGLENIRMTKIGETVLLAGRNGSGKTRLLNFIREQASNLSSFHYTREQHQNSMQRLQSDINQQPISKQKWENEISNYQSAIDQLPEQKKQLEEQIRSYQQQIEQNSSNQWMMQEIANLQSRIDQQLVSKQQLEQQISNYQSAIDQLPEQKRQLEEQISFVQKELAKPAPIITDDPDQRANITVVPFVPQNINLEDWANLSKYEWSQRAEQAKNLGVDSLHQSTIPSIQQVMERWVNTSNTGLSFPDEDVQNSKNDHDRLQSIVEAFLEVKIGWNKDGYATIFGRPIASAQLSAGQRVLLQLCVAIFAQGGTLSNYVIFMDEPENHLHPSAVIDLLDTIRKHNPNGQIWIATHSIPLLSHFDPSSLWFVEGGTVKHSGKKPELVLQSLLGDETRIKKLRDFTSLPDELARNRFAFECLLPPTVVETDSKDDQSIQLKEQLKILWKEKDRLSMLDFGAGKGRMIANLSDYEEVSSETLDYHAYDKFVSDKNDCLKNISLSYSDANDRYYNSIESLRTKLNDHYFDVVVLSNVMHEIPHSEWNQLMNEIHTVLKEDGYLLLIEDCRIPTGELPHINGFVVFNTLHLKKLFKIQSDSRFIPHDARFDSVDQRGRLMAHLIPSKYLLNITNETKKEALKELKNSAKTEIKKLRGESSTYSNGLAHGFWVQQLANAELCLSELGA